MPANTQAAFEASINEAAVNVAKALHSLDSVAFSDIDHDFITEFSEYYKSLTAFHTFLTSGDQIFSNPEIHFD